MQLKFHHLNLCTHDVAAMDAFYRDVLDMQIEPTMAAARVTDQGYAGDVSFVTDGAMQVHVSKKDLSVPFTTGQPVNPMERGHIAFRTDDIEAFKARLKEHGVPYADFGGWAMKGWNQVFFHDPDGNVVEVHQAPDPG